MYLLEKYELVLTIQAGLSGEWLEFSVETAYELAYAQRGMSVTSKGVQNAPEYFYTMYSYDLLNSVKSKKPQYHLYSVKAELSLGARTTLLLGFLGWGLFLSFGRGLYVRFKSTAAIVNGSEGSDF